MFGLAKMNWVVLKLDEVLDLLKEFGLASFNRDATASSRIDELEIKVDCLVAKATKGKPTNKRSRK